MTETLKQTLKQVTRELRSLRREVERVKAQEISPGNGVELGGIRRNGPATAWTKNTDAWEDFGGTDYFEQVFTKRLDATELIVPFWAAALHSSGTNTVWEFGLELTGTGEVGGGWKFPINPELVWQHISGLFIIGTLAPPAGSFTLTLRIRRLNGSATIQLNSDGRVGYRVLEVPSGLTWT